MLVSRRLAGPISELAVASHHIADGHYRERVIAPYRGQVPEEELEKIREELSGACTIEIAAFDEFAGLLEETWRQQFDHVVFDTALPSSARVAAQLKPVLEERFGFSIPLAVINVAELQRVMREHPWAGEQGRYASRQLVAFPSRPGLLDAAKPLLLQDWGDENFVVGRHAAWLWCPEGIARSPLALAFASATGDGFTARNWATVLKLQALTERP